ncbi:MAG: sulfatase-like hydrolase/transferase [Thermoanaerobaculia bacterium]|nr:sulfatase-like hydrolase/transferase [Thermoanaerobaculia bacterium]
MKSLRPLILLAFLAACAKRESDVPSIVATNAPVIVISIDTLRADHLPAYGYKGVETPNFDTFRRDAILYRNAYSHVPLTLPSHVSLLTGLLPPDHGVRNNIGFTFDGSKHETIPSLLKKNGYATGAAVSSWVLRGSTGIGSVFDSYDDRIAVNETVAAGLVQRDGAKTIAIAEQWIAQRNDAPFFFLLHLFEPHSPYTPPEPFRSRYTPYDGEIAVTDALLGRFFESLRTAGVYDRALIILLSDHGEGLGDHGEDEHGIFLYREALHVPLLLKLPGKALANTSVDAPAQLIDVLPTIASITGARIPPAIQGTSLLEIAKKPARRIFSESLYPRIHLGWSDLRSLVDDEFHYIDAPRAELFAASDTAERANVVDGNRRVVAGMRNDLAIFSREMPVIGTIDPEEAKKLAALGYLSSSSSGTSGPLPDPKDHITELTMMKEAAGLEGAGRIAEARAKYLAIIERNPRLTDAWTMLGRLYEMSGQLDDAVRTYRRAIQIAPSLAGEFALSLANVFLMMNKPDDAAAHARVGLATNRGNAHILLGRAALAKNDLADALREAKLAKESFSYEPAAMVLEAQILTKQQKLSEALAEVNRALETARAGGIAVPALLHYVRGDLLARMNRIDDAIAAFNEEIRLYPRDRQAYANLAVIYLLTGRRDEAQATMRRLVAANPSPASYELAAKTFAELGDAKGAAEWRRK